MKQIVLIFTMLLTTLGYSQDRNTKATMEVDGVCGECKSRIEKAAIRSKGVKSAVWYIDTHELKLIYDARKTDLKVIAQNIADVGHDNTYFKASTEAYSKIDACCKYRDDEVVKSHQSENNN